MRSLLRPAVVKAVLQGVLLKMDGKRCVWMPGLRTEMVNISVEERYQLCSVKLFVFDSNWLLKYGLLKCLHLHLVMHYLNYIFPRCIWSCIQKI